MSAFEEMEGERPQFLEAIEVGTVEARKSAVDGAPIWYYPRNRRAARVALSAAASLLVIAAIFGVYIATFWLKAMLAGTCRDDMAGHKDLAST